MHFSKLDFIVRPKYLHTFLPKHTQGCIGQLRVSSHQLEVENDCANGVPGEEKICGLCHIEVEDEYHFTCKCLA